MNKKFYAQYDSFVENHPSTTPSNGFANTKCAVAFRSIERLNEFIKARDNDLSCRRITRKEALTMTIKDWHGNVGFPLDDTEGNTDEFLIIREVRW